MTWFAHPEQQTLSLPLESIELYIALPGFQIKCSFPDDKVVCCQTYSLTVPELL